MDWNTVWQTILPLVIYILGQVIVYLKAQQAAGHAENAAISADKAAQHAQMAHNAMVRRNGN